MLLGGNSSFLELVVFFKGCASDLQELNTSSYAWVRARVEHNMGGIKSYVIQR